MKKTNPYSKPIILQVPVNQIYTYKSSANFAGDMTCAGLSAFY